MTDEIKLKADELKTLLLKLAYSDNSLESLPIEDKIIAKFDKLTAENAKLRELVGELVKDDEMFFTCWRDNMNPTATDTFTKHNALMSKVKEGGYAE